MPAIAHDVLIIYTDQWRWDALSCLGSPAKTPVLDAVAARGVHFDHAFVQSPVCMPSRVSMLTGQYPSTLGITHMGVPVPDDTDTIASMLGRRGFRTANIGKLHFLPHANRDHTLPHPSYGFDELALSDEPGVYEDDYRAWVRATDPAAVDDLSCGAPPAAAAWQSALGLDTISAGHARDDYAGYRVFGASAELTHTAWVATRTIESLRGLSDHERSLTIASFFSPHPPFHVPQQFLDLYERDELPLPVLTPSDLQRQAEDGISDDDLRAIRHGYYAAISEVDHHVGRILDTLDELGRTENTIIVFVADHGEWLGDHLRFAKGYPADDAVSRVPLIMSWPAGIIAPGRRESGIVEAVDVVPTILDALGIPVPTTVQGQSLTPQLGARTSDRAEVGVTEHDGWRSVRSPEYRYLVHTDGAENLWHVADDPTNEEEVTERRDEIIAEHRAILIHHMLTTEQPLPRTWAY